MLFSLSLEAANSLSVPADDGGSAQLTPAALPEPTDGSFTQPMSSSAEGAILDVLPDPSTSSNTESPSRPRNWGLYKLNSWSSTLTGLKLERIYEPPVCTADHFKRAFSHISPVIKTWDSTPSGSSSSTSSAEEESFIFFDPDRVKAGMNKTGMERAKRVAAQLYKLSHACKTYPTGNYPVYDGYTSTVTSVQTYASWGDFCNSFSELLYSESYLGDKFCEPAKYGAMIVAIRISRSANRDTGAYTGGFLVEFFLNFENPESCTFWSIYEFDAAIVSLFSPVHQDYNAQAYSDFKASLSALCNVQIDHHALADLDAPGKVEPDVSQSSNSSSAVATDAPAPASSSGKKKKKKKASVPGVDAEAENKATAENSDQVVTVENPDSIAAVENPDSTATVESSDSAAAVKILDSDIASKSLDSVAVIAESSDNVVTDESSDNVVTGESSDNVVTDESSDSVVAIAEVVEMPENLSTEIFIPVEQPLSTETPLTIITEALYSESSESSTPSSSPDFDPKLEAASHVKKAEVIMLNPKPESKPKPEPQEDCTNFKKVGPKGKVKGEPSNNGSSENSGKWKKEKMPDISKKASLKPGTPSTSDVVINARSVVPKPPVSNPKNKRSSASLSKLPSSSNSDSINPSPPFNSANNKTRTPDLLPQTQSTSSSTAAKPEAASIIEKNESEVKAATVMEPKPSPCRDADLTELLLPTLSAPPGLMPIVKKQPAVEEKLEEGVIEASDLSWLLNFETESSSLRVPLSRTIETEPSSLRVSLGITMEDLLSDDLFKGLNSENEDASLLDLLGNCDRSSSISESPSPANQKGGVVYEEPMATNACPGSLPCKSPLGPRTSPGNNVNLVFKEGVANLPPGSNVNAKHFKVLTNEEKYRAAEVSNQTRKARQGYLGVQGQAYNQGYDSWYQSQYYNQNFGQDYRQMQYQGSYGQGSQQMLYNYPNQNFMSVPYDQQTQDPYYQTQRDRQQSARRQYSGKY